MPNSQSPESYIEVINLELTALGALLEADLRTAGSILNDAAGKIDAMLSGSGRERLRYRLKSVSECERFILEMIPHQLEALRLLCAGNLESSIGMLHGHSSVLWRISGYLHDVAVGLGESQPLPAGELPHEEVDESTEKLIDYLDDLLDGEGKSVVIEAGTSGRCIWFNRQGDQLVLDFPVAPLNRMERSRALKYFQRIGVGLRGWDEFAIQDNDFSFMLDMGMNLDRSARTCVGIFREVFDEAPIAEMRITKE